MHDLAFRAFDEDGNCTLKDANNKCTSTAGCTKCLCSHTMIDEQKKAGYTGHCTRVTNITEYGNNLKTIIEKMKASPLTTDSKLIFALTTTIPSESEGRKVADLPLYNKAAKEAIKEYNDKAAQWIDKVEIHDLEKVTREKNWFIKPGDVHYGAQGNKELARVVGEKIRATWLRLREDFCK